MTENEIIGWDHRLNGHEFESTLGVGEGQGSLACCSPWGPKELDTTQQLNNKTYFCKNTKIYIKICVFTQINYMYINHISISILTVWACFSSMHDLFYFNYCLLFASLRRVNRSECPDIWNQAGPL